MIDRSFLPLGILRPRDHLEKRWKLVPSDALLGNFRDNSPASLSRIVKDLDHRGARVNCDRTIIRFILAAVHPPLGKPRQKRRK